MRVLRIFGLIACGVLGLAACGGDSSNNDNTGGGVATSLYSPAAESPAIPFPNDLLFADAGSSTGLSADATLNIPNADGVPFVADANRLDGFSTTAELFTDFVGAGIDLDSTAGGIVVINTANGQALTQGEDYQVARSSVVTSRPRLLIQPMTPLEPATQYVVVVTRDLRTASGGAVQPSDQFTIVSNPDSVGSDGNPANGFSPEQQATLEQVRTQLVRPIFDSLIAPPTGVDPTPSIGPGDVILTWSFTTQSIGDSLAVLANNPSPAAIGVANTGMTTGDVVGQPGADVFAGTTALPYYLDTPSDDVPDAPLETFWEPTGTAAEGAAPLGLPCSNVAQSVSTTGCYPEPSVKTENLTVPVLVARPTGVEPPADGWPVVIFQHGITGNRTNMLAIAPALAQAGFVTVAIDLPLHGITDTDSPLKTETERTFDLDLVNNQTSAEGPDGNIDASGTHFINLQSVITSRDNIREAVVDLINLDAGLNAGDPAIVDPATGEPTGSIDIDNDNIHFIGYSLGGIVGGTLLGVNSDIGAATLAMPGGGIARLLDGSASFGPQIAAGLEDAGAVEGTDDYENFLRFAQTVVDSADPVNYAAAASDNHPIHMIEVVGGANDGSNPPDLVVPNFVARNNNPDGGPCPVAAEFVPFLDNACEDGPLSGTDPLAAAMGLNMVTIAPPYTEQEPQSAGTVVRFTAGTHGSLLSPAAGDTQGVDGAQAMRTTCEMQRQTATFLGLAAAGGTPVIPIGPETCPGSATAPAPQ